jgi:Endonuclease NucS
MANSLEARTARIKTFVAELLEELPAPKDDIGFASVELIRRRKLSTLAEACGSRIVPAELLREMEREFAIAHVYTHRPLTSPALGRDDYVQLCRRPFAPDELFFSNEQMLKEYLVAGIGHFGPFRDLEREEREFVLPSRRRIDILCRERRKDGKGALVAIELKKSQQADGVVTQMIRYLEELASHALAKDRKVRGIIVSGRADDIEARLLSSEQRFPIEWYCYRVTLERRQSSCPL